MSKQIMRFEVLMVVSIGAVVSREQVQRGSVVGAAYKTIDHIPGVP